MTEILVGLDDNPAAQDAVAFARRFAATTGATLRVVSAYPYDPDPSRASSPDYAALLEGDTDAMLARVGADIAEAVPDRSPARALHHVAERTGAALVVVGSSHRGPVGRVMPGSTAERLLHGSPCPVAIVPRGHAEAPIATIAVGHDGSEESDAALATACALARRLGASLRVIRVFDTAAAAAPLVAGMNAGSYIEDLERERREDLERVVAGVPEELRAEAVFLTGSPGRELAGESQSADLMVVGSRGYGPARAVLLGGVTHVLVRDAACPVLVLPRGSRHAALDSLLGAFEEAGAP